MSARTKGVVVAALQVLLVLSLAGKLLYDRATLPRAWAKVQTYDPDLPIRGRYLWEQLRMPAEGFQFESNPDNPNSRRDYRPEYAYYSVRNGQLIASSTGSPSQAGGWVTIEKNQDGSLSARADESVFLFIPETANPPTLKRNEEFWMEVTIPRKGPPRPIRLALKHDNQFTPLNF